MQLESRRIRIDDGKYSITGTTGSDGQVFITNIDGWYEPEAALSLVDRLGDGSVPERGRWKERTIVVSGRTFDLDGVGTREHLRTLAVICEPLYGGTIAVYDEGLTLAAECYRSGRLRASASRPDGWVEWELTLVCPDPFLYGPAKTGQASTPSADFGLDWPLFINDEVLTWGTGADTTLSGSVTNEGTWETWPTVTVEGDLPSGFRITSSDSVVAWSRPVLPGSKVLIDYASHTVTVDGADQSWALTTRRFTPVQAGAAFAPTLTSMAPGGAGTATFTIRDTYL